MTPELFFTLGAALLGLCFGSFLNVVIDRMSTGRSIVWPPSACENCGTRLRPYELIPVLSWLALRGRCGHCGARIGLQYPAVEILTASLFALVAHRFGPTPECAAYLVLTSLFIAASGIDLKSRTLPDVFTLSAAVLALGFGLWRGEPFDALLGAIFGAGLFWLLAWGYEKRTGTEGLGLGDVKLMLSIGALSGVMLLPFVILFASLGALAAFGLVALSGREIRAWRLPLGPFLAAGAFVGWCWGDAILSAWVAFLR